MGIETGIASDRDFELWALLNQACDAIGKARDDELRQFGITRMQAAILFTLKAVKVPATPAEIARWLFREPNTVFVLLKQMERKGLVRRVKDLERKNMVRVVLTEKGLQASRRAMLRNQSLCDIFSILSEEEHANLRAYLWKLRDKALASLGSGYQIPHPQG